MSQRGNFRGGFNKGRGRPGPYNRDGGGFRKRGRGARGNWRDEVQNDNHVTQESSGEGATRPEGMAGTTPSMPVPLAREAGGPSPHHNPQTPPVGAQAKPDTPKEKKYTVRARLFVGNLPKDLREEQVRKMFEEFGEVQETFVQREKSFGFIRMAYRSEAERAVAALNGKTISGRDIKVRFAASNSSVKVSNLHPLVSNELLEESFAQFGVVEKAVVVTDERGKSLGYGIVDFSRKSFAMNAIRRCSEEYFILTKTPMPVLVAEYIKENDDDGQPEKSIPKNATFRAEREAPPRFAQPNSLEFAVASQWKMAYDSEKRQREELEQRLRQARNDLVHEMENIKEQHQTELIRQELAHHQQEQLRLVQELRIRQGSLMPAAASLLDAQGATGPSLYLADKQSESMVENTAQFGSGGGGAGPGFPSGAAGATLPLFPPPLMGQILVTV